MASRFVRYIQDTRREMAHVSWPTRAQTVAFTLIVVAISLFVAIYLSVFDAAFSSGVRAALDHAPRFGNSPAAAVGTTPSTATTSATGTVPAFNAAPDVTPSNSQQ
ncbi:MAG TPA: preprotein translocase subunit SecE [Candidatus Paceibacterota bacterium]|nr:preprotein translocase subunit SecE [Candidatus Paceibacterota bacterium]